MVMPSADNGKTLGSTPSSPTSYLRRNTKTIGDYAELKAATYFSSQGFYVSRPLSDNAPYDLIVDDGMLLQKVQVKARSVKKNGVVLVERLACNNRYSRSYQEGDFDILAVLCIDTDELALVPWEVLASNTHGLSLRVEDTVYNRRGVRYFSDFKVI